MSVNAAPQSDCSPAEDPVQLADLMQPGGPIDQALASSNHQAYSERQRNLHERLSRDWQSIQRDFARDAAQAAGKPSGEVLANVLWGGPLRTEYDPVLKYCIASLARLPEVANGFFQLAHNALLMYYDDYAALIRDIIPKQLAGQVEGILAVRAYREGTNPTAWDDWHVFVHIQTTQEQGGGLTTGIRTLDERLGGLRGVTLLGGPKGSGKTGLALQMSVGAMQHDPELCLLLYTLDMSKTSIMARILSHVSGVELRSICDARKLTEPDVKKIEEVSQEVVGDLLSRLRIVERRFPPPKDGNWLAEFTSSGNSLLQATGCSKLLIVIDLFQRMETPASVGRGQFDDRTGEQSRVALNTDLDRDEFRLDQIRQYRLRSRSAAQPDGVPLLIISELRKDSRRERLQSDDLRGSGRLAFDADNILLLEPGDEVPGESPEVKVTLRVDKGRDGAICGKIPLIFRHTVSRFEADTPSQTAAKHVERGTAAPPGMSNIDPLAGIEST